MSNFQHVQRELTQFIRNPDASSGLLGIEGRRLDIYRDLFFNNINGFLSNGFPVCRSLYSDSDWANCRDSSKSTGGGILIFGGMIVNVFCKRQTVIARSTTEAELYTGHKMAVDGERALRTLRFLGWNIKDFTLHMDNKAAVEMASHQPGSRKQSRSFRLRNHDMRELIQEKILIVKHVSGTSNPADGLTKPLSGKAWEVTEGSQCIE